MLRTVAAHGNLDQVEGGTRNYSIGKLHNVPHTILGPVTGYKEEFKGTGSLENAFHIGSIN